MRVNILLYYLFHFLGKYIYSNQLYKYSLLNNAEY